MGICIAEAASLHARKENHFALRLSLSQARKTATQRKWRDIVIVIVNELDELVPIRFMLGALAKREWLREPSQEIYNPY